MGIPPTETLVTRVHSVEIWDTAHQYTKGDWAAHLRIQGGVVVRGMEKDLCSDGPLMAKEVFWVALDQSQFLSLIYYTWLVVRMNCGGGETCPPF